MPKSKLTLWHVAVALLVDLGVFGFFFLNMMFGPRGSKAWEWNTLGIMIFTGALGLILTVAFVAMLLFRKDPTPD